jgi:putative methyltransferase
MDVYRQAAVVVDKVKNGLGTAKAMCLEKSMQKKKQTYAVACETLRRFDAIEKILQHAQFFQYYPLVDKYLAMVLTYDTCFGMGVRTKQHQAALAIHDSAGFLRQALTIVAREDPSIMKKFSKLEDLNEDDDGVDADGTEWPDADGNKRQRRNAGVRLPTYVRVNTLAPEVTLESVSNYFKKRDRDADDASPEFVPTARVDPHVPGLLVLPPASDLHKSRLMRNGSIVIQDKASCLPPCVLLGAVTVTPPEGSMYGPPLRRVVDACAAPGNKTTQLAALGAAMIKDGVRVIACEKDVGRAAVLRDRVKFLHAEEHITVIEGDFMELDNKYRSRAEGVLVDPSCSASGMVKRVDVGIAAVASSSGADDDEQKQRRVEMLARMQEKLLHSALTCYPRSRRVVYSTCSVHERENEEVVRRVLASEEISPYWALANIMPDEWTSRGMPTEGEGSPNTTLCIRCDPARDRTNGFFVACFDRIAAAPAS